MRPTVLALALVTMMVGCGGDGDGDGNPAPASGCKVYPLFTLYSGCANDPFDITKSCTYAGTPGMGTTADMVVYVEGNAIAANGWKAVSPTTFSVNSICELCSTKEHAGDPTTVYGGGVSVSFGCTAKNLSDYQHEGCWVNADLKN